MGAAALIIRATTVIDLPELLNFQNVEIGQCAMARTG
jgi:hypothetical protein